MTNYNWNSTGPNACHTGHYSRSNSPSGCCKTSTQALQCCENPQSLQNRCNTIPGQGCRSPRNGMYYYVSPTFYQNGNNENCCEKKTKHESDPKQKEKRFSNPTHDYASARYPKLSTCLQKCETYLAKANEEPMNGIKENPKKVPPYGRSVNNKTTNCGNKEGKSKENTSKLANCPPENCEISCEKTISSKCCKKKLDKTKDKSTTANNCKNLTCDEYNDKPKNSHPEDRTDTIKNKDSLPDCCKDGNQSSSKSDPKNNNNTNMVRKDDAAKELLQKNINNNKNELSNNYQTLGSDQNKIKLMVSQLETMEKYSVRKYITASEKIVGNVQDKGSCTDGISGKKTKLTCEKPTCPKLSKIKRNGIQTSSEEVLDNTEYNNSSSECCRDSISNIVISEKNNSSLAHPNKTTGNRYYVPSYEQTLINDPNKKMPGTSYSKNEQNVPDCCKNDVYNSPAFRKDVAKVTDLSIILPKALSTSNIIGIHKPGWTTLGNNKISQFAYSKEMILLELTKKQSQEKAVNVFAFPTNYTEGENQVEDVTPDNVETIEVRIESLYIKSKEETNESAASENKNGNGHEAEKDLDNQSLLLDSVTDPHSFNRKRVSIGSGSSRNKSKNELAGEHITDKNCSVPDCCTDPHSVHKRKVSIGSTTSRDENKDKLDEKPLVSDRGTDAHSMEKKKENISSTGANQHFIPCVSRDQNIGKHGDIGPYDEKKISIEIDLSDLEIKNDTTVTTFPKNKPNCCVDKKRGCIGSSTSRNKNNDEPAGQNSANRKPLVSNRGTDAHSFDKKKENMSSTEANRQFHPCTHPLHKKQDCISCSKTQNKNKHDAAKTDSLMTKNGAKRSLVPDCCVDTLSLFGGKSSDPSTLGKNEREVIPECCSKKPRIDKTIANTSTPCKNGTEQRKSMSDYNACCKEKIRSSNNSTNPTRSLQMPLPEGLPKWLSCCKSTKCPVNDPTASTYAFLLKTRLCCNHKDCKLAAQICDMYEPQNLKIHISEKDNFGDLEYHYLATDAGTAYEPIPTESAKPRTHTPRIVNEPTIGYVSTVGYVPNIEYGSKIPFEIKPEGEEKIIESSTVNMYTSHDDDEMYRESVFINPEEKKTSREVRRSLIPKGDNTDNVNKKPVTSVTEERIVSQEKRFSTVSWKIPRAELDHRRHSRAELDSRMESTSRLEIDMSMSTAEIISQATAEAEKFRHTPQPNTQLPVFAEIKMTDDAHRRRMSTNTNMSQNTNMSHDVIVRSELNSLRSRESRHRSTCWNFLKHKMTKRRGSQDSEKSGTRSVYSTGTTETDGRKRVSLDPVEEKQQQLNNMLNNL